MGSGLMPTVEQNVEVWNRSYAWSQQGDEWSQAWGGTDAQWYAAVFPRVRHFLPAATILEIAPGYGRWTRYLGDHCRRLIGVDLSSGCIDACRERFAGRRGMEFHVNDGRSLDVVTDGSIDFAFSFDSLVHAEDDVLDAYVHQLATKLTPDGVAFIHHSNAGEHIADYEGWDTLPRLEVERLERLGERPARHWRAMSMTAARMQEIVHAAGLVCSGQEILTWGGALTIDCISVIARPGSELDRPTVVRRNTDFTAETRSIRGAAAVYG